jgi:hypothetical protein
MTTWVWTGLSSRSHNQREESIHEILDEIDRDMGVDSDSNHALAALPRIKAVTARMQAQAAAQKAEQDSLIAAANPENEGAVALAPSEEELARQRDHELFPDVER